MEGNVIDLVTITSDRAAPVRSWPHGRSWNVIATPSAVANAFSDVDGSAATLFLDERLSLPSIDTLRGLLDGPGDVWHAGVSLGLGAAPELLDHVSPTWMLNAPVARDVEVSSWRVSFRALLVRNAVLEQLGPPDTTMDVLSGASLDLGLRWIQAGAIVRNVPNLAVGPNIVDPPPSPLDSIRSLCHHRGQKWATWAALRGLTTGQVRLRDAADLGRAIFSTRTTRALVYRNSRPSEGDTERRVSVVLPTVDRYPFLIPLLGQLAEQTVPVHEVIVVDQTASSRRREDLIRAAPGLPITVICQDTPGQSTARNAAIRYATGDAFLFIDDDDEIPDDLVEQHLRRLGTGIDASCGGVDDATAGPPPPGFLHRRISDVFPTNNSMVTRAALIRSGLFDTAYDRGPRADHDLGMRLHLSGALLVYDPSVMVFHHHAPSGGLRTHEARRVTRASARRSLAARHLPATTQSYLWQRYFRPDQVANMRYLSLLSQIGGSGSRARRLLRAAVQISLLPSSIRRIRQTDEAARMLVADRPPIPVLNPRHDESHTRATPESDAR
ncbi:MAG: glycosyltransferase family 2 protein [Acidimicrobiales bacterium]|nr:glycosyltransferase family 2 protein [Acidimicrobiales bacterium]